MQQTTVSGGNRTNTRRLVYELVRLSGYLVWTIKEIVFNNSFNYLKILNKVQQTTVSGGNRTHTRRLVQELKRLSGHLIWTIKERILDGRHCH